MLEAVLSEIQESCQKTNGNQESLTFVKTDTTYLKRDESKGQKRSYYKKYGCGVTDCKNGGNQTSEFEEQVKHIYSQMIINGVQIFCKSVENTAFRCCVKKWHWQLQDGWEQPFVKRAWCPYDTQCDTNSKYEYASNYVANKKNRCGF